MLPSLAKSQLLFAQALVASMVLHLLEGWNYDSVVMALWLLEEQPSWVVMRRALNVVVATEMLDSLGGGKVMLLESHMREEKVCTGSPLPGYVFVIGVVYVGSRDGDTYDSAWDVLENVYYLNPSRPDESAQVLLRIICRNVSLHMISESF